MDALSQTLFSAINELAFEFLSEQLGGALKGLFSSIFGGGGAGVPSSHSGSDPVDSGLPRDTEVLRVVQAGQQILTQGDAARPARGMGGDTYAVELTAVGDVTDAVREAWLREAESFAAAVNRINSTRLRGGGR